MIHISFASTEISSGNLNQEDLPWYKSNECKIAVGMAVLGGVIGGCSSKKAGGSFEDGFADGFLWGSVSGALSFVTGALVSYGTSAISEGISRKRMEKAEGKVYSRSDSKTVKNGTTRAAQYSSEWGDASLQEAL